MSDLVGNTEARFSCVVAHLNVFIIDECFFIETFTLSDTSNPQIARDHNGLVDSTCMSVSHIRIACPYEPPRGKTNNVVSEQV